MYLQGSRMLFIIAFPLTIFVSSVIYMREVDRRLRAVTFLQVAYRGIVPIVSANLAFRLTKSAGFKAGNLFTAPWFFSYWYPCFFTKMFNAFLYFYYYQEDYAPDRQIN